jgi:uncharacterized damage-inducible protein DinB
MENASGHGLTREFREGEQSMATALTETSLKGIAFVDLEREIDTTRRLLERLPADQFSWKPHEKSMSLGRLAMHVATLLQWFLNTIQQDELDIASPPQIPMEATSRDDLLGTFEQNAAAVTQTFARMDDAALSRAWTLRNGEQVLFSQSRGMVLRVWCLSHLIHHRAQLCVYLRLLNLPVPAIYFNSVDEPAWVFA